MELAALKTNMEESLKDVKAEMSVSKESASNEEQDEDKEISDEVVSVIC